VACKDVFPCNYKTTDSVCAKVHALEEGFAPGCCFIVLGNEEYLSSISYSMFIQDPHHQAQQIVSAV